MAVFRIEKTRDYTVMSNHHLKDRTLTLKSKGLLSMMLSLPDEWNYTTRGLAAICREGVDSIGAALKELETHGYIRRTQLRDEKGKITDTEYVIYETPQCELQSSPGTPSPDTAKPYTENPDMGIPDTAEPCTENPAQLNTNQEKIDLSNTHKSNPILSNPPIPRERSGQDSLESIYTRFNVDRPADFTGHSLSVSDIVVLHQDGKDTAHYCDRFGFSQVPEFLQPERAAEVTIPTPDQMATQERSCTPRGSFCVTNMTREQMQAAGYGVHHQSDDGKYLIMGNGARAFAVLTQQLEQDNPLRTAEMTLEDDYGMIDGVINNGRRGEELEKAQEYAERTTPEKPSIRERLADAKRECAGHKPPEGKKPGRDVPEQDCL